MLIDSKNIILGRLASFAAKHALLGENVDIVNCESAVITGNKKRTLRDYNERLDRGSKAKGPFVNKRPDMFVKRVIRGMLPYRKENGKKALKRIKCYIGVPDNFKNVKAEKLYNMDISKLSVMKYATVGEICTQIGGKI